MALPISAGLRAALASSYREVSTRVSILNHVGTVLYGPNDVKLTSGQITADWSQSMSGPVRTAQLTFADPEHELRADLSAGASGAAWFDKKIHVEYGVKVAGSFEWIDVFLGFMVDVTAQGDESGLMGVGKETHNLAPWLLGHSWEVTAGTQYSQAIRDLVQHRGISEAGADEFLDEVPVQSDDDHFQLNKHYGFDCAPQLMYQHWARQLDRQFFWRANGKPKLRPWPNATSPEWTFVRGDDSIVLDWPDQRISMKDSFNQAFVMGDRIVDDGPHAAERPEPVVGFAELPDSDPMSRAVLNPQKPMIRIFDRPNVRHFGRANQVARQYIEAQAALLETEMSLTCMTLPQLEEMDVVRLDFGTGGLDQHFFRLKNFHFDLPSEDSIGQMEINVPGHRRPLLSRHRHRHRQSHGRYVPPTG